LDRVLLEKLTVTQLVRFLTVLWNQRSITVFTGVCHWSLCRARWI